MCSSGGVSCSSASGRACQAYTSAAGASIRERWIKISVFMDLCGKMNVATDRAVQITWPQIGSHAQNLFLHRVAVRRHPMLLLPDSFGVTRDCGDWNNAE